MYKKNEEGECKIDREVGVERQMHATYYDD